MVKVASVRPASDPVAPVEVLDVRGKACPIPVARTAQTIASLGAGDVLEVLATDPDIDLDARAWAARTGHELLSVERRDQVFAVRVRKR